MVADLRFGVVPGHNVFTLTQRVHPMLRYLERSCECTVRFLPAFTYEAVLDGMLNDKYDMVLVGPQLYVQAKQQGAPFTTFAQPVRDGSSSYRGMVIAKESDDIYGLADLKGRSVAFVDRNSSGGYLFPRGMLAVSGIRDEDFTRISFSGSHDQVVKDVLSGAVDIGVCYEDARKDALKSEPHRIEELRVVARTLSIPNEPFALADSFRKDNSREANRLIKAFTTMHASEDGRGALQRLGFDRFEPVGDEAFEVVRTYLAALK